MSFLLALQTQEATTLDATISMKQAKTRMSRQLAEAEGLLPPPLKLYFLQAESGLVNDLESKTSEFKGIAHAFSNNN